MPDSPIRGWHTLVQNVRSTTYTPRFTSKPLSARRASYMLLAVVPVQQVTFEKGGFCLLPRNLLATGTK